MVNSRYYLLSALSGCVWSGIAYFLSHPWVGSIWGGILASPLIGIIVAFAYRPGYKFPLLGRFFTALLTLYLAVTLFGFAIGLSDAVRDIPDRVFSEVVLQPVLATLWGVTFGGFVLVLWPLAFLNHWILGRLSRKAESARV